MSACATRPIRAASGSRAAWPRAWSPRATSWSSISTARRSTRKGRAIFLERFIHGEIFRARPDVQAVVHSHSPNLVPFGATPVKLKPLYHMTGFLGEGVPVFEIRKVAGSATNLLITDNKLGKALARTLGEKPAALMRGHGSVVVGQSLQQAVYRAIYMELNARLQSEAMRLGRVTYLTSEEARAGAAVNDRMLHRPWELWKRKAMAK